MWGHSSREVLASYSNEAKSMAKIGFLCSVTLVYVTLIGLVACWVK